jgi:hypothetical protein
MRYRRAASLVSAGLIIGATFLVTAAPAAAHDRHKGHVQVLLKDLSSPKGIAIGSKNSVVIGQGAFGPPGPVLEYVYKGKLRGTTTPLTDPVNVVDIAMTPDGAGWAIGGDWWIYRMTPDGTITPILDMAAYQAADLDPYNVAPQDPAETNPYGLTALKTNDVLVADAAGNDIIRVSPDGTATTVARFTTRLVKTDKVGDPTLPPKLPAEAVPTSIAIGRDGWAYVGQLVGFPGRPGSAKIWRVNPYAEDAVCDASHKTRDCKVWKSGFTSIIDLAFNPKNGTLYVYEIAKKGWLAFEEGFTTGVFPKAVLLEVRRGHKPRELVKGKLQEPGGVVVARDGTIFVTDGMFSNGRLVRVRR